MVSAPVRENLAVKEVAENLGKSPPGLALILDASLLIGSLAAVLICSVPVSYLPSTLFAINHKQSTTTSYKSD